MSEAPKVDQLVDHLFRREAGKMVAVLSRMFGLGNIEIAEDIVQETMLKALSEWKYRGLPERPEAWLYTVAKRRAIDEIRHRRLSQPFPSEHSPLLTSEWTIGSTVDQYFHETEIADSQLRMFFACCHPQIAEDARIALVLRTLCGFGIDEIARAFLTTEETISKRLYRAKERIRERNISLEPPSGPELTTRLDSVLKCIYLMFNEGYSSTHSETSIRRDVSLEAMRLCKLLTEHPLTDIAETNALMALLCYAASRFDARLDENGNIMRLTEQDRNKWDRDLIQIGNYYIDKASVGSIITQYHLEAAIMSVHSSSERYEQTDWTSILRLYDMLISVNPSEVIRLNRAIAMSYAISPQAALTELLAIDGLDHYHLYHAALGDIYHRIGDDTNARASFEQALKLTSSRPEQELLLRKIHSLQ